MGAVDQLSTRSYEHKKKARGERSGTCLGRKWAFLFLVPLGCLWWLLLESQPSRERHGKMTLN